MKITKIAKETPSQGCKKIKLTFITHMEKIVSTTKNRNQFRNQKGIQLTKTEG